MENTANHITLTGTLASLPEYSHQNHERRFFRFLLAVERLSGTEDLLPVLAAEDVLEQAELFEGEQPRADRPPSDPVRLRAFHDDDGRAYAERGRPDRHGLQATRLPADTAWPADYRSVSGRAAPVPQDGLHPLYFMGPDGAGRRRIPDRHGVDAHGPPPKPDLSQESGRDERNTHRIRTFRQRLRARPGIRNFLKNSSQPMQPSP